jgi:uncharacterized membrane protein YqjE
MHAKPSLFDSLSHLLHTLVSIIETRLELLATDFEEARARVMTLLLMVGLAIISFGLAIGLTALFVVVLFWDSYRLAAVGGAAGFFLLLGLLLWLGMLRKARGTPRMFVATRTELSKDRERLAPPVQ